MRGWLMTGWAIRTGLGTAGNKNPQECEQLSAGLTRLLWLLLFILLPVRGSQSRRRGGGSARPGHQWLWSRWSLLSTPLPPLGPRRFAVFFFSAASVVWTEAASSLRVRARCEADARAHARVGERVHGPNGRTRADSWVKKQADSDTQRRNKPSDKNSGRLTSCYLVI